MKILILEDDLERIKHFGKKLKQVFDFSDDAKVAIEWLKKDEYDYIYLDHDLGGEQMAWDEENCGMTVAKYIEQNPLPKKTKVIIHSFNVYRAQQMQRIIPGSLYIPGVWLQEGLP